MHVALPRTMLFLISALGSGFLPNLADPRPASKGLVCSIQLSFSSQPGAAHMLFPDTPRPPESGQLRLPSVLIT